MILFIFVLQTEGESVWTAPDADTVNMQLDSDVGLENLDNWVSAGSANAVADHYMLVTWLVVFHRYIYGSMSMCPTNQLLRLIAT